VSTTTSTPQSKQGTVQLKNEGIKNVKLNTKNNARERLSPVSTTTSTPQAKQETVKLRNEKTK
jgi:hypothetical protein